jgi:hypothetical protein
MIPGFNTDVKYEGRVYHVQTEDRGLENPVLESLVYVGGIIIAKKRTSYGDELAEGATEDTIANRLKRQHQVIIAAIKAGRIDDLVRQSAKETDEAELKRKSKRAKEKEPAKPARETPKTTAERIPAAAPPVEPPAPTPVAKIPEVPPARVATTGGLSAPPGKGKSGFLNLDEVISDYLKRNSEQGKLDLKVITPNVFIAGKSIGLRVQITTGSAPEPDAVVTIKIIGTAFKPQVYIGRAGVDGIASFSLLLPAFSAGTAAIVIEAQSKNGRGELKQLIRRS